MINQPLARSRRRLYAASALLCSALPIASAQNTESEEVFELSPFVITAEDSSGYRATSTLAGTRIKTDLKDLGSSISVVTEEFLADTGATSVEDLLTYTMGTEVGGPEGNFSGTELGTGALINDDEARRDPSKGARLRGVSAPNYTRNYFSTDIPIDSYNTSGITISRGPNSLLFGLGSPAGVIDNSVKLPIIGENSNKLSYRYGSHGSNRATFDTVQTIVEDRLAVKASGLYDETNYRQEPAFEREKRAYFAFTGVIFKNENSEFFGKTSLRGNVEVGEAHRTPPASFTPSLAYEPFFAPPPDFRPYNGRDYTTGYDNLASTWQKWGTIDTRLQPDGRPGYNENQGDRGLMPYYSTPFFFTSATTIFQQDGSVAVSQDGTGVGGFTGFPNEQSTPSGIAHRPNLFVNTRAYEEASQGLGFKAPSLTNRNVFDYRNNLITAGTQTVKNDFDAQTFVLEQPLFNNKGDIEIAVDQQYYNTFYHQPFGGGGRATTVYVDTTEYLINGAPNPNVGRAFLTNYYTFDSETEKTTKRDNQRATAYFEHDFSDMNEDLGKWLGRHRFTGLYQKEETTNLSKDWGKYLDGQGFTIAGGNDIGWGRQVAPIYYISGDLRGVEMDNVRLHPINGTLTDGMKFDALYFDNPNDINSVTTRTIEVSRRARGGSTSAVDVKSKAFAWQSYLLNGNLVGLVGLRSDEITSFGGLAKNQLPGGTNTLPGGTFDHSKLILDPNGSTEKGDTQTYSLVAHLPQKFVENLPVSSLSMHVSKAENFQAIAIRHDHYNQSIGNPNGTTNELGLTIGFNEDKWNLRINRFETEAVDSTVNTGATGSAVDWLKNYMNRWQEGINTNVAWEANSPNTAIANAVANGWTGYNQVFDAIKSLLPEPAASIYDFTLNAAGTEWENKDTIKQLSSVQDVTSKGYEIELVGNPIPNWRVAVNATKVKATPTASVQALQDYSTFVQDRMKATGLDKLHEGVQSIVFIPSRWNSQVGSPVASVRAKDDTSSQELREWRVNAITNYDFTEGRLSGFGVGGALRYQSKVSTGSAYIFDDKDLPIPDLNNLFYGDSELNGDLWLSYRKKLGDKIDWKVQLNVRNLIGSDDDIPVFRNPDGVERVFRIAPETSWFLTNTFEF